MGMIPITWESDSCLDRVSVCNNTCIISTYLMAEIEPKDLEEAKVRHYAAYQANISVAKEGVNPGELKSPRGLAIDLTNQNVLVADSENGRVQVFTHKGDFISTIGVCILKSPWGVCVNKTHIFVTDVELHTVFKFRKPDFTLVSAAGKKGDSGEEFNFPGQLGISHDGFLYVPDRFNNRIQVLSPDFTFLRPIKKDYIHQPIDVRVTLTAVFILCNPESPCIHILREEKDSKKNKTIELNGVRLAFFFCIDPFMNFIVSDFREGLIRVFKEEKLTFTFGEDKVKEGGEGKLVSPCGLAFSGFKLVNVSQNMMFGLQIFFPPPMMTRFIPD